MKKFQTAVIGLSLIAGFVLTESALAGRIADGQVRQQERIQQGVASGKLTANETQRLEKTQQNIQESKRQAWRDGELTRRERVRLEKQQVHANRQIYRLKHNEREQTDGK